MLTTASCSSITVPVRAQAKKLGRLSPGAALNKMSAGDYARIPMLNNCIHSEIKHKFSKSRSVLLFIYDVLYSSRGSCCEIVSYHLHLAHKLLVNKLSIWPSTFKHRLCSSADEQAPTLCWQLPCDCRKIHSAWSID